MRNKAYKAAKFIPKNSGFSTVGLVLLETTSLSDGNNIAGYAHTVLGFGVFFF